MSKYLLSIFVCLISVSFAVAQEEYGVDTNHDLPVGLNVGDKAPYFKAHDLEGNLFDSKETLKDKDIILIFYRGHWCAACDIYLSNISDSYYLDSGEGVVLRFLANAGTWRGETAKRVKLELKAMVK